jgi:hypothetical protein
MQNKNEMNTVLEKLMKTSSEVMRNFITKQIVKSMGWPCQDYWLLPWLYFILQLGKLGTKDCFGQMVIFRLYL